VHDDPDFPDHMTRTRRDHMKFLTLVEAIALLHQQQREIKTSYDEAGLGVYSQITDEPHKPPIGSRDFQFIIGVYNKVLTSGEWPIVGDDPFGENEDPWPPPRCMIDSISGKYSIYHHGKTTPASAEECQHLEVTAVWDRDHIIDRILRGNESK